MRTRGSAATSSRAARRAIFTTMLAAAVALAPPPMPASAVEPDEVLKDSGLEARARHISAELRCLVCQNQSIDDSSAPLARDLRLLVRERLKAGDSDDAVRRFLVERYGEFVLLKPPFALSTLLLWLAPFVALLTAVAVVGRSMRGRAGTAPGPTAIAGTKLSEGEEARLAKLLAEKD